MNISKLVAFGGQETLNGPLGSRLTGRRMQRKELKLWPHVLALRDLLPLPLPSSGSCGGEASALDGSRAQLASAAKGVSGKLRDGCRAASGCKPSPPPPSSSVAANGVSAAGGCASPCSLAAAAAACSALMRAGALVRSVEAAEEMPASGRRPWAWREPSRCCCCMRSSTASMDLRGGKRAGLSTECDGCASDSWSKRTSAQHGA